MSSVPELVAEAACAAPQAIALESGSICMSYGELDAAANRLAIYLKKLGAEEERVVGVCLPRSFEQIVACLAVLKSGAAYLPLDPAWPQERLRHVLNDAQAPAVVTAGPLLEILSADHRTCVAFDRVSAAVSDSGPAIGAAGISPKNLAYVIYTSGSTGEPKGVEITHGNLENLVAWHRQAFGLTNMDRTGHLAGLSFDASVWEVWPTLVAGATLVLTDETTRTSSALLRDWLIDRKISVSFVPTVLAEPLMKAAWPSDIALRYLLTGAETLHSFPPRGLPFAVINNYGPTECTVLATSGRVPAETGDTLLPTIGSAIPNTQIYFLDENGGPVAEGESGEICIGGACVGRGYRNRPQLTAECFLPDPFSSRPGARMYRTGDLGRALPDGQIVFQGRVDNQEKIRGYRVEPDEVATALNRHPAITSSAVIADGPDGERRLAAYFVQGNGGQVAVEELRDFLTRLLPDHMIPGVFVRVDALPQTANGKLDKSALPKPAAENTPSAARYRAPSTPAERRLAEIVAKVLGADRVGVDDNFFLIGGHSLLGTQVVLQVRQVFGVDLTLRHLFKAPTVASLAASVEQLVIQKIQSMSEEEAQRQVERVSVPG
ncbi:MAG TPA: non-ribosomal peptide synthetase [Pseudolabrys sp.]|nr:non-ribosomal peptide synthetase [Pseudolabrys sp.]